MAVFTISFVVFTLLNLAYLNKIVYIGIAFLAILVLLNRKYAKILLFSAILATISFNTYNYLHSEVNLVGSSYDMSLVALENEVRYDDYSVILAKVRVSNKKFNARVYFENDGPMLKISDEFKATGYVYIPENKSGFNKEKYYKSKGINVFISLNEIKITKTNNKTVLRLFGDIKAKLIENIDNLLSEQSSMFVKALVLGDKTSFTPEFNMDISKSGISHIVVVSGMHIAFLFAFLKIILGRKSAYVSSIFVIIAYVLIVGISPSVIRAVIMQFLMITAWFLNRKYDSKSAIFVALIVLLLLNPYTIYDAGFILSFASVFGILYIYVYFTSFFKTKRKILNKYLIEPIFITLSVFITTLIPIVYYFSGISSVSVLSNIFIVPFVTILFPLCLLFCLISFVNLYVASIFAILINFLALFIVKIITIIGKIKFSYVSVSNKQLLIYILVILVFGVLFRLTKYKKTTLISLILSIILLNFSISIYNFNSINIDVLSVNDGQCIFISYKDEITVVDIGSTQYANSAEKINEIMYKYAYKDIDNLIITSMDNSHMRDIFDLEYPVLNIVMPKLATRQECFDTISRFISENNVAVNQQLPEYIQIFDDIDKKLAVLVYDTLTLHTFTNNMINKFSSEVYADTVILAEKSVADYKGLQVFLDKVQAKQVVLSNAREKLRKVSGIQAKSTIEYGDIKILNGGKVK